MSDLIALTRQNARRNLKALVLTSIGIVVGIGAMVFFLALGAGMKDIVLQRIFVVDQLEVVPKAYEVGAFKLSIGGLNRKLDDAAVERLARIPGVVGVYPKLKFGFKAMAWTPKELLGRSFYFEIFGDGIAPDLVPDFSRREEDRFADLRVCSEDTPCLPGLDCVDGQCVGPRCDARTSCPPKTHCLKDLGRCEPDIPVLISPHLVELFNGSVASAFGFPKISEASIVGLWGTMRLGKSFAGREASGPIRERVLRVVGVSPKAITFGATLPISYVREFNQWYGKGGEGYDSAVVEVGANDLVPSVVEAIEDKDGSRGLGFELAPRSREALRAGIMISVLTLVFSLISMVILGISSIHIAHTFFMILSERRAEIGLLRAIGASRADIRRLVLLESSLVGLMGGLAGWLLGRGAGLALDLLSARFLPDFPYKPESYFSFTFGQFVLAMAVALGFCLIGAWLPAKRAADMDPARALTGR